MFTDADLRKAKEWRTYGYGTFDLDSLIERLETAERCAYHYADKWPDDPDVIAWLKSAGK